MLKIDLGCGQQKEPGFTGVDRFKLPGVDVIADLDGVLPFDDDTVDLVFASHSLEHVHDLIATMREVYRVCKHGAQICILAPYNEQKLNLANPYHICVFNEHTPRFWSDYPESFIDPEEYVHPQAPQWGLSRSDNSNPGLDLRLVRMEFLYFPEYRSLPEAQQRKLRHERLDVCDQIIYNLIVWKGDERTPDRPFSDYIANLNVYEPNYVRLRKAIERDALIQTRTSELQQAQNQIAELQNQLAEKELSLKEGTKNSRQILELKAENERLEKFLAEMRTDVHQLRMQNARAHEKIEILSDQFHVTKMVLGKSQLENEAMSEQISSLQIEYSFLKEQFDRQVQELDSARSELAKVCVEGINANKSIQLIMDENHSLRERAENGDVLKSKMALLNVELETTNDIVALFRSDQAFWRQESAQIKAELDASLIFHESKEARWASEFNRMQQELISANLLKNQLAGSKKVLGQLYAQVIGPRSSRKERLSSLFEKNNVLWNSVAPAFEQIKRYSEQNFLTNSNARLVLGEDLGTLPYREYKIPFQVDKLSVVSLAINPLVSKSHGIVGIEIVSSLKHVVAQVCLPLSDIDPIAPTNFIFAIPLQDLGESWYLRVFAKDVDVPVALYEFIQYSTFARRIEYRPFAFLGQ